MQNMHLAVIIAEESLQCYAIGPSRKKRKLLFSLTYVFLQNLWHGVLYMFSLSSLSLCISLTHSKPAQSHKCTVCVLRLVLQWFFFFQCDDLELSLQAACPCCILFRVCYSANIFGTKHSFFFSDNGYFLLSEHDNSWYFCYSVSQYLHQCCD